VRTSVAFLVVITALVALLSIGPNGAQIRRKTAGET
jgi:hypothetical protein